MRTFAIYHTAIASIAFLALTYLAGIAEDRLPPEERERLRRIVTMKQQRLTDAAEMEKAVKTAARSGAADVLEGAINNPDPVPSKHALELLPTSKLTVSEKRRILIAALLNPSIWPQKSPFPPSRSPRDEAGWSGAMAFRDMLFREAVLDAFAKHLEQKDLNMATSQEARIALAKEIGGPEVGAALSPPDGAKRVGPPKERGAGEHGKEGGGATSAVALAGKPDESSFHFGLRALWVGLASVVAAVAGWLLFRRKGRGGKF